MLTKMKNAGFSKSETTHPSHNERFQVSQNQFPHPSTKAVVFTPADLHQCLYKRNEVTPVSEEELKNSLQHKQEEYSYCKWMAGFLLIRIVDYIAAQAMVP